MELTKIQKLAVDHVETKVADLWKKILILANNVEHEDEDATKYRMLCKDVKYVKEMVSNLAEELNCRIGIDLGPDMSNCVHGLARIYLLSRECVHTVMYNGNKMTTGGDGSHELVLRGLAQEFQHTLIEFLSMVDKVNDIPYENNIDDEVEQLFMYVTFFKAVNDFMALRFGEDDSGIIIFQPKQPADVLLVKCYQPYDAARVDLVL